MGAHSFEPSISDDGRYVAYATAAGNAAVNWSGNGSRQVVLIDRDANGDGNWDQPADLSLSQLVTVAMTPGTGANALSRYPRISGDGSCVTVESSAANLVANDNNGRIDIFVRDRTTSATTRVSVDDFGTQADRDCLLPRISTNGRFVVFDSISTNLDVTQLDPSQADVFLHDRQSGTTRRVSQSSFYGPLVTEGVQAGVTDDGRFVAFRTSSAFDPIDGNFRWDVYVKDRICLETIAPRQTGQPFESVTEPISSRASGALGAPNVPPPFGSIFGTVESGSDRSASSFFRSEA